jgi:hypothetical protein
MPYAAEPFRRHQQNSDARSAHQRTADKSQHGHTPWHQAGAVHQVAQQGTRTVLVIAFHPQIMDYVSACP